MRPERASRSISINFGWRGLTSQLFVFVVLPLAVLLIVVAVGSLSLHQDAMRLLVGQRDQRAARTTAAAIAAQLRHRADLMTALALYAARAGDLSPADLASYSAATSYFDGGLALFRGGRIVAASNSPDAWQDRPAAELVGLDGSSTTARFSPVFADGADGSSMMLAAAAGPSGLAAVGAFSVAELAGPSLTSAAGGAGQSYAVVVDAQARLLASAGTRPEGENDIGHHPGVAEALKGENGATFFSVGNDEHVVAYAPIPEVGWALLIEEPWTHVDNPLLQQTQAAPLLLIPILVAALIALSFGLRQVIQPLRALERQASELSWGRFQAVETPVGGIAEIRHLQAELVIMARKLQAAQQNLRSYLGAITVGQEDERRRLARELHDGAVQSLIALDQRAQLAQMTARSGPPETAARLAEVRQMTAALMDEVRRVIRALRPIYLEDLGLLPALEMLVRDMQTSAGVRADLVVTGQARRLTASQEIATYRIVQEATHNAAHYAAAEAIAVKLEFASHGLTVRVEDNGRGFNAPERVSDLAASGHYGLMGMQERAELIGATLVIRSAPGAGTTIGLHIPL